MAKLVAYFSASGVTAKAAENLAKAIGAELFEIKPETPYTNADLDWRDADSRSTVEMKDETSRPAMASRLENVDKYDTVFIGFPVWWYTAPRIIDTFLESADFTGKTMIPFATSGGSGMGSTVKDLQKVCPDAKWKNGKVINGMTTAELIKWAENV